MIKRSIPFMLVVLFLGSGAALFGQSSADVEQNEEVSDVVSFTYEIEGLQPGKSYEKLKPLKVENFLVTRSLDVDQRTISIQISGNGLSRNLIQKCVAEAVPTEWGIRLKSQQKE